MCYMPSAGVLSAKLRHYLKRAGVERAELFASDETRKAITLHDLRATGITWMAVRGDEPLRTMQRAGHASFETTQGYRSWRSEGNGVTQRGPGQVAGAGMLFRGAL
jgi:integrase